MSPRFVKADAWRLLQYFYLGRFALHARSFPFLSTWIIPYIRWLLKLDDAERVRNDATLHIVRFFSWDRFAAIENDLKKASAILGLTKTEFATSFKLLSDWDKSNAQKIGDLLAEVNVVIALNDSGFIRIRKLPESETRKSVDFIADRNGVWGVEVKNIRLIPREFDSRMTVGRGDAEPTWRSVHDDFSQMLAKVQAKIKYHKQEILEQFRETRQVLAFDQELVVFHTHDTVFLFEFPSELQKLVRVLKDCFPEVGNIAVAERTTLAISH